MKHILLLISIVTLCSCSNKVYETDYCFETSKTHYTPIYKNNKGYFIYKEDYTKAYFPKELQSEFEKENR